MKKGKIALIVLSIGLAVFSGFLIKKSFIDKGYPSDDVEKEILLGNYVVMLGLPNTKENRDKYRKMTIEQIKKEIGFDAPIE